MRRALGVLCASVGLLLAGSSLVAPAATAVTPSTPTAIYVTIIADLSTPVAGRPTDFTATLRDEAGSPLSGQTLTLGLQAAGSADFMPYPATTDSNGSVTVWATLDRNAVARWTYDGDPTYAASTPVEFGVQIAPLVTARAHDRTLRRGQRLVVTGHTFPVKAGCRVNLWRGVPRLLSAGPAPKLLARSTARADGSYRLVRRFHHTASMRVAVTVASCEGNARGLSRAIAIRVR